MTVTIVLAAVTCGMVSSGMALGLGAGLELALLAYPLGGVAGAVVSVHRSLRRQVR